MKTTLKKTLTESTSTFLSNEEEIRAWLDQYKIKDYTINGDMTVSVKGGFALDDKGLEEIPVKFAEVGGSIDVTSNKIKRIDWAPSKVNGDFDIWDNEIETLEGGPTEVTGGYDCDNNRLTSLNGAPAKVGGSFVCSGNKLTSLKGCPKEVGKYFKAMDCGLTVVDDLPESVGTNIYLLSNEITSLKGINKIVKRFAHDAAGAKDGVISISGNPISGSLLSVLSIKGFKGLVFEPRKFGAATGEKRIKEAVDIINKAVKEEVDVFDVQEQLIAKDLEEFT